MDVKFTCMAKPYGIGIGSPGGYKSRLNSESRSRKQSKHCDVKKTQMSTSRPNTGRGVTRVVRPAGERLNGRTTRRRYVGEKYAQQSQCHTVLPGTMDGHFVSRVLVSTDVGDGFFTPSTSRLPIYAEKRCHDALFCRPWQSLAPIEQNLIFFISNGAAPSQVNLHSDLH